MALLRTDFTTQLTSKGYEIFWETYDYTPDVWQELFEEKDTNDAYVEDSSMMGMGDLVEKEENEPITYDAPMDGYPCVGKVRTFSRGMAWSYESYKDTEVEGLFETCISSWSESYKRTRDRFYAQFFNYGAYTAGHDVFNNTIAGVKTDPTGNLIYDGVAFFSTAHPDKVGNTYSNYSAALTLTYDNLRTVYETMTSTNAFDDKGDEIEIEPDTILVPPSQYITALSIVNSDRLPHDATTPSKPNPFYNKFEIIKWRRLTDTDCWILLQRKKGLVALNREDVSIDVWVDPETKQYKASILARFGGYVRNWRWTYACNLPTSG